MNFRCGLMQRALRPDNWRGAWLQKDGPTMESVASFHDFFMQIPLSELMSADLHSWDEEKIEPSF